MQCLHVGHSELYHLWMHKRHSIMTQVASSQLGSRSVHCCHQVFNQGELPADLEDLYARAQVLAEVVQKEPAIEPLVIQLKYGPWRAALLNAWADTQLPSSSALQQCPESSAHRAQTLLQVLTLAARHVSKEGVSKAWTRHAGRGVARHSGGAPVLRHLGVLIASSVGMSFSSQHKGEDSDSEDQEESLWRSPQTKEEMDIALGKLERFITGWDKVRGAFTTAPTTCEAWCENLHRGLASLKALASPVPRLPRPASCVQGEKDKYTTLWTFRACMLLRMHQEGVSKLRVGSIPLRTFCRMNPDENENILRIVNANRKSIITTQDLMRFCGVSGVRRPELLSAELCLVGDRALDSADLEHMDVKAWRCAKQRLKDRDGMSPHIAMIAKAVHKQQQA